MAEGVGKVASVKQVGRFDKWIPWYFVAFFVVLAILDGIFVYVATQTHTGVVSKNTYQAGLDYNETIKKSEAQDKLGWTTDISFNDETLKVRLLDSFGAPLTDASVEAFFFRPTQDGSDFLIPLGEGANGNYITPVQTQPGQWDVRIYVTWQQTQFQTSQRIIVPQP